MLLPLLAWLHAETGAPLNLGDALVYYGIAAPFLAYLLWQNDRKDRLLAVERALTAEANKATLEVVLKVVPLVTECTSALERTAKVLGKALDSREGRRDDDRT